MPATTRPLAKDSNRVGGRTGGLFREGRKGFEVLYVAVRGGCRSRRRGFDFYAPRLGTNLLSQSEGGSSVGGVRGQSCQPCDFLKRLAAGVQQLLPPRSPLPRRAPAAYGHDATNVEAAETGDPSAAEVLTTDHPRRLMVDIIKSWA